MKTAVNLVSIKNPIELKRAVESIPKQYPIGLGCQDIKRDTVKMDRDVKIFEMPNAPIHVRSNAIWSYFKDYNVLTMCDDCVITADTIPKAERMMENKFPDTDGVIGVRSILDDSPGYSFCLYGSKFIDRLPNRQFYCSDYEQFVIDREWWNTAQLLNKFAMCENANMFHLANRQKILSPERADICEKDSATFRTRRALKLFWGINSFTAEKKDKEYKKMWDFMYKETLKQANK